MPDGRNSPPLVAGNWKMHGLAAELGEVDAIADGAPEGVALLVCPPATLIAQAVRRARGRLKIGGQDCHTGTSGAHTGELSAAMLADAGASHVIAGHSERRADHGETDDLVRAKAEAAVAAGLVPIVCVGETQAQRDRGETLDIVRRQAEASLPGGRAVLAYEPVWAIGTGRTPTADEVARVHAALADATARRVLYGGSVKPANAALLLGLPHVAGALVGGASLRAADFLAIARAAGGAR